MIKKLFLQDQLMNTDLFNETKEFENQEAYLFFDYQNEVKSYPVK